MSDEIETNTKEAVKRGARPTTLRWRLAGAGLPPIEHALWVGERFKEAVHGAFGNRLPEALCDKDSSGEPLKGHTHPFYLPEDADGDGKIDHVILHAPLGLSAEWLDMLDRVRPASRQVGMLPQFGLTRDWLGTPEDGSVLSSLLGCAQVWRPLTPYVANTHLKRRLVRDVGLEEAVKLELKRELRNRRYRHRSPQILNSIVVAGRSLRPEAFRVQRLDPAKAAARGGTKGVFFRVVFDEPIVGPLTLGYASHLGLGLFQREDNILARLRLEADAAD